jgi:hypothetical protein
LAREVSSYFLFEMLGVGDKARQIIVQLLNEGKAEFMIPEQDAVSVKSELVGRMS